MTNEQPHIRICKWDDLQHYKDRNPPWIKLYNRLLDSHRWGCLPDASKGHYTGLLMLASREGNRIPLRLDWIAKRIAATAPLDLRPLVNEGLIEVYHAASEPLAQSMGDGGAPLPLRDRERDRDRGESSEGSLPSVEKPSGEDAAVENSPEDDSGPDGGGHEQEDRKALAATLRRDALLGKSSKAAETKMASNMDIADQLHDDGYPYGKLEDAVMGARLAIKRREDTFDGWIDPGDTFGMGIFRHADEQGVKLVEVCATYWYKHGETASGERRNGQPEKVRAG